jgi:hypothetical protein
LASWLKFSAFHSNTPEKDEVAHSEVRANSPQQICLGGNFSASHFRLFVRSLLCFFFGTEKVFFFHLFEGYQLARFVVIIRVKFN